MSAKLPLVSNTVGENWEKLEGRKKDLAKDKRKNTITKVQTH